MFSNVVLKTLLRIRINPRCHRLVVHQNMNNTKPFQISYQVLYQRQLRLCQLNVRNLLQDLKQASISVIVIIKECGLDSIVCICL
nr:MAG TPA: hypothetical protein [Caudoviricetes sp.]